MSIKLGNKMYELVPDRLKKFREENPKASIDTEPTYNADGSITFKATIIRDQSDEYSARSTGNARYIEAELKEKKAFEKLETISIGRALANIGYLNDGQIASTEELMEFNDYKQNKTDEAVDTISSIDNLDTLKTYFLSLGGLGSNEKVFAAKEAKKKELAV